MDHQDKQNIIAQQTKQTTKRQFDDVTKDDDVVKEKQRKIASNMSSANK